MNHLPSFLCIGTQKAGTSWLYEQLRYHPDIWLPPFKELHYFDHLYCKSSRSWSRWHIRQSVSNAIRNHVQYNQGTLDFVYIRYLTNIATGPVFSEAWYEQVFQRKAAAGKILGDITPEYCTISEEGIAYVQRFLGKVKIIWIIRDPVDRALSQLKMNADRQGFSMESSLVSDWLELAAAEDISNRGDYLTYLPRWERFFGPDELLFIPFRRIAEEPQEVLRKIEAFLGASEWDDYPSPWKKIYATKRLSLPDEITAYFQTQFKPQYDFLASRFDGEFMDNL